MLHALAATPLLAGDKGVDNRIDQILARIRGAVDGPDGSLLTFTEPVAKVVDGHLDDIDNCLEKLRLPRQQLNPEPLLTGNDLIDHGIPPGKQYQRLLRAVRDAQLEQRISSRAVGSAGENLSPLRRCAE